MRHVPFFDSLIGAHGARREFRHLWGDAVAAGGAVAARAMFASVFLIGGYTHFARSEQMIEYTLANGVSGAELLVPLTGLMLLAGGLSVLLGYYARLGAALLAMFLIPTAVLMHRFWGLENPGLEAAQFAHFMKNMALAGAALLMIQTGSGPGSLDRS